MLLVRLSDGLGNQLFQYAYALCLSKAGASVQLDRSWFPEFGKNRLRHATPRAYALGHYALRLPMAPVELADQLIYGADLWAGLRRLLHKRPGLLREGRHDMSPQRLVALTTDKYVRGFFQEWRFPEMVRSELLEDLRLPESVADAANLAMAERIRSCPCAVALHIRRGDYLNEDCLSVHGLCSADYYARAVQLMTERTGQAPHLFVFSDDPAWVVNHFHASCPMTPVDINSGDKGYLDLNLMRACRHAIIANSTFSWWGAWLIENPDKVVVAPEHWFADGRDSSSLCPAAWLRV